MPKDHVKNIESNYSNNNLNKLDNTKERLLLVAEELFAKKGFSGTSVREIGVALGIANSSILYYFPSKEKLYAEVLKRIADSIKTVTLDLPHEPGDAPEQIQLMTERIFVWAQNNTCYLQIIVRELMENSERLTEERHLYLAGVVDAMRSPLDKAKGEGKLGSFDPALFLIHLIGSLTYFSIAIPTISHITGNKNVDHLKLKYKETLLYVIKNCVTDNT